MRDKTLPVLGAIALLGLAAMGEAWAAETTPATPPAPPPAVKVVPKATTPPPNVTVLPATPKTAPAAAATPAGPAGTLELKETMFDAGKVERGSPLSHTFMLKNIGKGDLTVEAKAG